MSLHWGNVNCSYPSSEQIMISRKILDLKDNLTIHGHHAHCLEGIEVNKKGIISYSLGDFIFDTCVSINGKFCIKQMDKNLHSCILSITVKNGGFFDYAVNTVCDSGDAIVFDSNESYSQDISNRINDSNTPEYQQIRSQEFINDRDIRAEKHNLKWFVSRCNYYSLVSKLLSFQKKQKYKKVVNEFRFKWLLTYYL